MNVKEKVDGEDNQLLKICEEGVVLIIGIWFSAQFETKYKGQTSDTTK